MAAPVVDITSLQAVESLFHRGTTDPWGAKVAGRLADLFIFSDHLRFTMPVRSHSLSLEDPTLPTILGLLRGRDRSAISPLRHVAEERCKLTDEYLRPTFEAFAAWSVSNSVFFKKWLALHKEIRRRPVDLYRVRPDLVFDVGSLTRSRQLRALCAKLGLSAEDAVWAFDIVLRYPLYGRLAGAGSYFLAHPIREAQTWPITSIEPGPAPPIPLTFGKAVAAMVGKMNLDEYTSFLHEARGFIHDRKIHTQRPGSLTSEAIREIAGELGLPARLKKSARVAGVVSGTVAFASVFPALVVPMGVAGAVVTMVAAAWSGNVGRLPAKVSWLRWALEWDLENQASDK